MHLPAAVTAITISPSHRFTKATKLGAPSVTNDWSGNLSLLTFGRQVASSPSHPPPALAGQTRQTHRASRSKSNAHFFGVDSGSFSVRIGSIVYERCVCVFWEVPPPLPPSSFAASRHCSTVWRKSGGAKETPGRYPPLELSPPFRSGV